MPGAPAGVPDSFDEHVKLMFDLQALAFQADVTRVFSFKMGRDASSRVYPESGIAKGFHPASHHGNKPAGVTEFNQINRYHVSLLPYFMAKLQSMQEGDATLLDRTMIIYGSPMADGNLHNHKRCPLIVLGGANGQLPGNRHIQAPAGTPMANAMLTMMHKIGLDRHRAVRRFDRYVVVVVGAVCPMESFQMIRNRRSTIAALVLGLLSLVAAPPMASVRRHLKVNMPSNERHAVADAAMRGDVAAVRALLKDRADVNAAQGDGMTALHWAAESGNQELAQLAVEAGANPAAATRIARHTPLHVAAIGATRW